MIPVKKRYNASYGTLKCCLWW